MQESPRKDRAPYRLKLLGSGWMAALVRGILGQGDYRWLPPDAPSGQVDLLLVCYDDPWSPPPSPTELRRLHPDVPMIGLLDRLDVEAVVEGVHARFHAMFVPPIQPGMLRRTVEQVLQGTLSVEALQEDLLRATYTALAHYIKNTLTSLRFRATSVERDLEQGTLEPRRVRALLRQVRRAEQQILDVLEALHRVRPGDREVYVGQETMLRLPLGEEENS